MKMLEDAKVQKFDLILAKEVSRFSRDTIDSLLYTRKLLEYDVCVYFLSDNIITASNDGELRLTIMSSMAQDEIRKLSERTKFGFKRAIEKGTVLGTNNIWGYQKQNGKLIIDDEEAKIVKIIFETYANTKIGLKKLALYLEQNGYLNHKNKPFHQNTLKRIIQNPKYKGFYTGNLSTVIDYRSKRRNFYPQNEWKIYKDYGKVPPIVSETLWQKANEKLLKRSKNSTSNCKYSSSYPLSGKIYCLQHNCSFVRKIKHYKNKKDEVCWVCKNYHDTGKKTCSCPNVYEKDIYSILAEKFNFYKIYEKLIVENLLKLYNEVSNVELHKTDKLKLQNELNKILLKKDRLLDFALDGLLSKEDLKQKEFIINNQIDDLKSKLNQLEVQNFNNKEKLESYILLELNSDNLDDYIDKLLNKIIIKDNMEIVLNV